MFRKDRSNLAGTKTKSLYLTIYMSHVAYIIIVVTFNLAYQMEYLWLWKLSCLELILYPSPLQTPHESKLTEPSVFSIILIIYFLNSIDSFREESLNNLHCNEVLLCLNFKPS